MAYPNTSNFTTPETNAGWWLSRRTIEGQPLDTVCSADGLTFARQIQSILRRAIPDLDSGSTPWFHWGGWPIDPRQIAIDGRWGENTLVGIWAYLTHFHGPSDLISAVRSAVGRRQINASVMHAGIWVQEYHAKRSGTPMPELYLPPDVVPLAWNHDTPAPPGWTAATAAIACAKLRANDPRPEAWALPQAPVETAPAVPSPTTAPAPGTSTTTPTPSTPGLPANWNPLDYESPVVAPSPTTPSPGAPSPSTPPPSSMFGSDTSWADSWFGTQTTPDTTSSAPQAPGETSPPPPPAPVRIEDRSPLSEAELAIAGKPPALPEGYVVTSAGTTSDPTPTIFGVKWWIPVAVGGGILALGLGVALLASRSAAAPAALPATSSRSTSSRSPSPRRSGRSKSRRRTPARRSR